MSNPYVTVVLPAFNEEEAIGKVIDDVKKSLDNSQYSYEILVVDDQSTDKTPEIAKKKGG